MLQISNLTKSYGERVLFENITFGLRSRERLGLVGKNGCGKSTLFKLILGVEHQDSGSLTVPRGYTVGHLAQHLEFHQPNIVKEACLGLPAHERDQEYRAEIILTGLGFSMEDMQRPPAAFSGGFQIRLNLAKLLLSEPNLLLLDEPTNYLDIVSMRWLIQFLCNWPNELIVISHDRSFMDAVTTDTMLIHRGTIRKMPGGTEKLYAQVALDEEIYEKTRVNEDKKRKELETFINRFRAQASKASLVQSKVKALERMGKKDELVTESSLDFRFYEAPFPGKQMMNVEHLSFSYPDGPLLIDNLSLNIKPNDRIGIIGKNGKGKSTLLRLLNGELDPVTGSVSLNQNAKVGYFGQTNISRLNPKFTVEDEVTAANPTLHRTKIRGICGTMMFEGDDALKKISVLSGGEKSRVLLGKILAEPTNLLLLDEPTNHLDMDSIDALMDAVKKYHGAVIIVTHSELLLRKLVNRLVVFQGNTPTVLEHGYDYFLDHVGWPDEQGMSATGSSSTKNSNGQKSVNPKTLAKQLRPLERKIANTENQIVKMEEDLKKLELELSSEAIATDIQKIMTLSSEFKKQKDQIELLYSELEKQTKEYESKKQEAA
jgi:ATP-binding cassette subfamily F protein 3